MQIRKIKLFLEDAIGEKWGRGVACRGGVRNIRELEI
jgi:hypothetical protein